MFQIIKIVDNKNEKKTSQLVLSIFSKILRIFNIKVSFFSNPTILNIVSNLPKPMIKATANLKLWTTDWEIKIIYLSKWNE